MSLTLPSYLPRYTWAFVKAVAVDVASGGGFLHSQRIVHRDLKSPNVLLTPDGHAKLVDFGIARWCGVDDGENRCLTQCVGTIVWSAPELLLGEPHTEKVVSGRRDGMCGLQWLRPQLFRALCVLAECAWLEYGLESVDQCGA